MTATRGGSDLEGWRAKSRKDKVEQGVRVGWGGPPVYGVEADRPLPRARSRDETRELEIEGRCAKSPVESRESKVQ